MVVVVTGDPPPALSPFTSSPFPHWCSWTLVPGNPFSCLAWKSTPLKGRAGGRSRTTTTTRNRLLPIEITQGEDALNMRRERTSHGWVVRRSKGRKMDAVEALGEYGQIIPKQSSTINIRCLPLTSFLHLYYTHSLDKICKHCGQMKDGFSNHEPTTGRSYENMQIQVAYMSEGREGTTTKRGWNGPVNSKCPPLAEARLPPLLPPN